MSFGFVEEIANRYYEKHEYLVSSNIRFQLKKEYIGKKVAGWSDIDLVAINQNEFLIIQCKSFLGTKGGEEIAEDIENWFVNAIDYLEGHKKWKSWLENRKLKNILVVYHSVLKAENILKKKGIEIISYENLLKDLLSGLKKPGQGFRKGKEDDIIIRLLCALIDKKFIDMSKIN